ncbi:hypothetical protein BUH_7421 [Burkholderia pseudomallei Pakistan 9]|nr:hypothetical protein BUH_7421 [Burkholderia pseudomallei Pakistan 9]
MRVGRDAARIVVGRAREQARPEPTVPRRGPSAAAAVGAGFVA